MRRLLLSFALGAWAASPAQGAGTVGSGTPASCTEAALAAALESLGQAHHRPFSRA